MQSTRLCHRPQGLLTQHDQAGHKIGYFLMVTLAQQVKQHTEQYKEKKIK